jgi:uncharacterized membrane protein YdjX (TVP38/TMEM64 family)
MSSEQDQAQTTSRAGRWRKPLLLSLLLIAAVWLGRYFGHHLPALENWIASHGVGGIIVFVGVVIVFTSIFVPDTLFAIIAGALFGLAWGTVVAIIASLCTATVNFLVSRLFLHETVRRWLARNPRLAAIERAVNREGFRFQFLLRLTPLHPVTVSYMLGASNTRYPTFLAACLGLIPGLAVEVYFGYVAKHVAKVAGNVGEHSALHSALTIAGLALCVVLMVYVTRLARKAIAGYEQADAQAA